MNTAISVKDQYPEEVLLGKADTLGIQIAVLDRRLIKAAGRMPLLELPAKECTERIGSLLTGIFKDLAIRTKPTPYDGARFMEYLRSNHPKFTTTDVKEAFEMFIAGRFDHVLPKKFDHYQQFSAAFYAKILKAYVERQAEARIIVRSKVQTRQMAIGAPTMPMEVMNYRCLRDIRAEVANAIAGQVHFRIEGFTHDWLVRLGVCSAVEAPTEEELSAAANRLKVRKGAGFAFTYHMQRILAGETVSDVQWEAMTVKRRKSMVEQIQAKGEEALAIIDAHLRGLQQTAEENGHEIPV